ncbi:MAG: UDP-N-acetylmuramoyl-L-alanine--D-glutamate ligase [Elusimicrobiota bacterium]
MPDSTGPKNPYKGKRVLVAGMGVSGLSAVALLKRKKAVVSVYDCRPADKLGKMDPGIKKLLGRKPEDIDLEEYDFLIVSPGIPPHNPLMENARKISLPVKSELQLGLEFCPDVKIIAVTGTNGKTTTCSFIESLTGGRTAGNIGKPLTSEVAHLKTGDLLIIEASSYQIPFSEALSPYIGVLLNLFPEHIDWHGSSENYTESKKMMFLNQKPSDISVFNREMKGLKNFCEEIKSSKFYFSFKGVPENGTGIDKGKIFFSRGGKKEFLAETKDFRLEGKHNLENLLAALCVSRLCGMEKEISVSELKGIAHRFEHVGTFNGIKYINDSKATNIHSTCSALESLDSPAVLLMGGRSKGVQSPILLELSRKKVKKVIAFGESSDFIYNIFKGKIPSLKVKRLKDAIKAAVEEAKKGDTVIMSPGGSSFDEFENYSQRGRKFKKWLKEELKIRAPRE